MPFFNVLLQERLLRMFEEEHKRLDSEISAMMATLSVEDSKTVQATTPEAIVPMINEPVLNIAESVGSSEEPMMVQELGLATAVTGAAVEKPDNESLED